MRTRTHRALSLALLLIPVAFIACDEVLLNDPGQAGGRAAIALTYGFAANAGALGGPAEAFDQVDQVHVLLGDQSAPLVDRFIDISPSQETRVRVDLDLEQDQVTVPLFVELLFAGAPVFNGFTQVTLRKDETTPVEIQLNPVAFGIDVDVNPPPVFTSIGDTAIVRAVLVFATGDTIGNAAVTWSVDDPAVATIDAQGHLVARGEGATMLHLNSALLSFSVPVVVVQLVHSVTIAPNPASVPVNGTVALSAVGRDTRGNVVRNRQAAWNTLNPNIATVDPFGVVRGVSVGQATITATMDTVTAPATINVQPVQSTGSIAGSIRTAVTGGAIAGATVTLRSGTTPTAPLIASATSDASGNYLLSNVPAGTFTLFVDAPGYISTSVTNITLQTGQQVVQHVALSPSQAAGETRIVLVWGATPQDLDSHLTGPIPQQGTFWINYSNPGSSSSSPFALLDIDDTDGFGPETITIYQQFAGPYCYSVHNYSGETANMVGARVQVYRNNQLVATYSAPTQSGTVWTVFKLDGSTITPVNSVTSGSPPGQCP